MSQFKTGLPLLPVAQQQSVCSGHGRSLAHLGSRIRWQEGSRAMESCCQSLTDEGYDSLE